MNPIRSSIGQANFSNSNNLNKNQQQNNSNNIKKPVGFNNSQSTITINNFNNPSNMTNISNNVNYPAGSNNTSNTKSNASNNFQIKNKENTNNQSNNIESQLYTLLNGKKNKNSTLNNSITPQNINQMDFNNSANNFLNNYNQFKNRDSYSQISNTVSPISRNEFSEDDLQKLTERHEKLINKILIEEESYIGNHRKHVDEMVEIMKDVFNLLNLGNEQYQHC
jgi:hypothetical protein